MHQNCLDVWGRRIFALVLAGGSILGCVAAYGAGDSEYSYYNFKQPQSLTLDQSKIAILGRGDDSSLLLRGLLDAVGFKDPTLTDIPLNEWTLLELGTASGSVELAADPDTVISLLIAADVNQDFFFTPVFEGQFGPLFPTETILVRFMDGIGTGKVGAVLDSHGMGRAAREKMGRYGEWYKVHPGKRSGGDVLDLANRLAQDPTVVTATPNMAYEGSSGYFPNDAYISQSWGIYNFGQFGGVTDVDVDGLEVWDRTLGNEGIVTVVIDTGIDPDHPDLHLIDPGIDTTDDAGGNGEPLNSCDNHGTPVAGIIAAVIDNQMGSAGIAPHSWVVSARAMRTLPNCQNFYTEDQWTIDVLEWAFSRGYRVTNNSNGYGYFSPTIAQKYEDTRARGMIHFACAGNHTQTNIWFPASAASVIAVSGIDSSGDLATVSNWGSAVVFTGPAEDIYSTDRTGVDGWAFGDFAGGLSGTSFASPMVAGIAALLLGEAGSLDPVEVEELMIESSLDLGAPGRDTYFGWGLPNARALLDSLNLLEDSFDAGNLSKWSGWTP